MPRDAASLWNSSNHFFWFSVIWSELYQSWKFIFFFGKTDFSKFGGVNFWLFSNICQLNKFIGNDFYSKNICQPIYAQSYIFFHSFFNFLSVFFIFLSIVSFFLQFFHFFFNFFIFLFFLISFFKFFLSNFFNF